jgi:predicted nuclease of predicted toxin-antitoxin system
MRLLADQNVPGDAVARLRAAGHDVAWVRLDAPGSPDADVLARAVGEGRILLSFDKDFGELAWRAGLPAAGGFILLRLPMPSPATAGETIAAIVAGPAEGGCFWGFPRTPKGRDPAIHLLLRDERQGVDRRPPDRSPGVAAPALARGSGGPVMTSGGIDRTRITRPGSPP